MKSLEKANQLIHKFANHSSGVGIAANLSSAKACSLICVEEMIKEHDEEVMDSNDLHRKEYWEGVIYHIESVKV